MSRWDSETASAANYLGYQVVETDGNNDYQGWGVHLLRKIDRADSAVAIDAELEGRNETADEIRSKSPTVGWAVLSWSYGSCSGCDGYEEQIYRYDDDYNPIVNTHEHLAEIFGDLIEECADEESARLKFKERKGW